ncbi:MAG: hypothetical protein JWL90_1473 [Chthoniobacteraceae bacterium]|nr:hypothetical protein [Chthoniobacteraceae bacterium]
MFPVTVLCLAAIGLGYIWFKPELERNIKSWIVAGVILLTLLLNLLWYLFLSRVRLRTKLITVLALAAVFFGIKGVTRVDGTLSGIGFPKLVWKWSPPRGLYLDPARPAEAGAPIATPNLLDVPQFFGTNRDGNYNGPRLARDWKLSPPKELWRHPIGPAWSAFAVVAGRAYTQEQRGEEEAVTCYDVLTGRLIWTHTNPAHFFQWQGGDGPRATPTIDRGQLFCIGATGILECLDPATGATVWSRDVLKENNLGNLTWGISGSPLVFY